MYAIIVISLYCSFVEDLYVSIIVKIQKNFQIIIQVDVRKKANIKVGDLINLKSLKRVFFIKPQEIIDLSQVWFWPKEWQTEENKVEKRFPQSNVLELKDVTSFLKEID